MADYDFLSTSNGSGEAALMHVTGTGRVAGTFVIPVDVVTNVPAKFIATYGSLLPTGYLDPVTKRDFKGHVSGNTVVIDAFEPGSGVDNGNSAGQVVLIKPTTGWSRRVAAFIQNMTGFGVPEPVTNGNTTVTGTLAASGATTLNSTLAVTGATSLAGLALSGPLSGLTSQITTFTNTGTAGGTYNVLNLGGIKAVWGITGPFGITPNATSDIIFNYPTGTFANAPVVFGNIVLTVTSDQYIGIIGQTNTGCTIRISNKSGGTVVNETMDFFAWGT